jgi:DtxR family Mn-dependent transcriptional regulator
MKELSLTEEDYLKTIYQLWAFNHFNEGVSTNEIAQKNNISAASVTDMLRKLSQKEYINYVKYQGVTLTEAGKQHAVSIIRKHRLWETFLVHKLKFRWDEVHEIAEQLEHIQSPLLINRLDEFLDFPAFDPHGDPIPNDKGEFKHLNRITLREAPTGVALRVVGVEQDSTAFLQHLNKIKVNINTILQILERSEYDASLEIQIAEQQTLMISREVSENIYVITA